MISVLALGGITLLPVVVKILWSKLRWFDNEASDKMTQVNRSTID
jgi:hypothetical protein